MEDLYSLLSGQDGQIKTVTIFNQYQPLNIGFLNQVYNDARDSNISQYFLMLHHHLLKTKMNGISS